MRLATLALIGLLLGAAIACSRPPAPAANNPTTAPLLAPPTRTVPLLPPSAESEPELDAVVALPTMSDGRAAHTATLLPDGRVLIAGGFTGGEAGLAAAELFDPGTRTFSSAGAMTVPRQSHSATLLPDGRVLLAGGLNGEYLASAELYDPTTGLFTPTGSMTEGRSGHVALLLSNGQVLLAGGTGVGWSFLASAELYDPASGTFTPTGSMGSPRESHTATLLPSGEVLIAGGHQGRRSAITIFDSAELYSPDQGTFRATAPMTVARHKHDATLLADGRVLISGGSDERDGEGAYRSTEIFDPATGSFAASGPMQAARYKHTGTSVLLPDGQVLLVGGAASVERFDPQSGTSRTVEAGIGTTRLFATTTLLPSGQILVAGGYGTGVAASPQAWLLTLRPG